MLQEGALVCDGGWSRYPAEAWHASRCEKSTAHQERRCDAEELEQQWRLQQLSPGPGWGFQKVAGFDRGKAKESSLQSGDQLTLEMRSTIPSLVSRLYLRLLLPKLFLRPHPSEDLIGIL